MGIMINDSYAEDEIDNTFEVFYSYEKILCLVYSTNKKTIVSYNLLIKRKMLEIKNAHDCYITNFRHYFDENNQRNLILSVSGSDNNLKVWNFINWECLINIRKVNKKGSLDSACILNYNNKLYIITSNNYEQENDLEKSEQIKIFDFNGNKEKEIEYSDCKTFFILTHCDDNSKINYITTGNEGYIKSYDYNNNKLYHIYYKEENNEPHFSLIVKRYESNTKIIESCWDNNIRVWDFHKGTLIEKISMYKSLHGICLLDDIHLCVGCGKRIKIVNIENGKIIKEIKSHEKNVWTIKKIYHPYFKDCILAQGAKKAGVKIFFFEYDISENIKKIDNINDLKMYYFIENIIGDGNCLFYSLSKIIFGSDQYYNNIRQLICDYYESSNVLNNLYEKEEEKKGYITKMRKDKEYGSVLEIQTFSNIFKIRIYQFTRYIDDKGYKKSSKDKITTVIIGEQYEGNFAILLNNYKNNEILNHFQSIKPANGKVGINEKKLQEIKEKIIKNFLG